MTEYCNMQNLENERNTCNLIVIVTKNGWQFKIILNRIDLFLPCVILIIIIAILSKLFKFLQFSERFKLHNILNSDQKNFVSIKPFTLVDALMVSDITIYGN